MKPVIGFDRRLTAFTLKFEQARGGKLDFLPERLGNEWALYLMSMILQNG